MSEKVLMKGNEAIAEAAIRAGCRHYFGYPITPQTEIAAYMAKRMPKIGGCFLQAESEISAINMVYGVAGTGYRVMTSSSSPGISLKGEGISYLAGTKLPAVIVNISRGGPGLGSIQPAQSDYLQATKALGHGGFRTMVFAPATLQEAVDLTYNAWDYAERDRNPVLILMDGCLGAIMEEVELPPMKELDYTVTEDWDLSKRNGREDSHMITPILPEMALEMLNKFKGMTYNMWGMMDVKVEEYLLEDAEYVVVAYGIAARVAKEAINTLREEGYKVGMIRPITLYPFPKASLDNLDYGKVKGIIDIEMTIPAQMRDDIELQVKGRCPVHEYGRSGGMLLDDEGVYNAISEIVKGGE